MSLTKRVFSPDIHETAPVISTNEDLAVYLILISGNSAKYLCCMFGSTAVRADRWHWRTNQISTWCLWGNAAKKQTTDSLRIWISGPNRRSRHPFTSPSHARGKYKPYCVFDNEVQRVRRDILPPVQLAEIGSRQDLARPSGCLPGWSSVMATRWRVLPCDGRGPDGGRLSARHPSSRLVAGTNSPAGNVDGLGTKPSKTVPSGLCKHARPCGAASQAASRDSEMLKKKPLDRGRKQKALCSPPLRIVLLCANHCLSFSKAFRGRKHLALTYMLLCCVFISDADPPDTSHGGVYGVAQVYVCGLCCLCCSRPKLLLSCNNVAVSHSCLWQVWPMETIYYSTPFLPLF